MSLADKVAEAFEKASVSMDPTDWRVYHALQAWLDTERAPQHEPADTTGLPDPPVSMVHIRRRDAEN
jgi:hypothetical protein